MRGVSTKRPRKFLVGTWRSTRASRDSRSDCPPVALGLDRIGRRLVPLAELHCDVLDAGVLLHRVDRHVLPVARLLEAAVRHLGGEREQVLVDPHGPEVEPGGRAQRTADVLREDGRREAVPDPVGHRDRVLVGREALHRHHRAEDLALDDLRVLLDVGDDRRRDEEALVADRAAAGDDGRLRISRPLEEAEHALLLVGRDHGPHVDVFTLGRVCDLHRLDDLHGLRDDVVVDTFVDEDARGRRAVLTGVPVAPDLHGFGDRGRIRVVEHDHRRLAAELEVDALEVVRRVPRDLLPRLDVARQRHETDVRVADEPVPDGNAVAREHLDDAGRHDLLGELEEAERGQRRLLGRLEDLDVAGGERRPELPDDHHQGVVPGRDAGDDPERLAPDDRRVPLYVLGGGLPLEIARSSGEEAKVVGRKGDLVARDRCRLAHVPRLELPELLGVLLHHVGQLEQDLHPVLRRLRAPLFPRCLRGVDRALDIALRAARHLGDHLAGRGIEHLHRLAVERVHPLSADEVLVLGHRYRHLDTSRVLSAEPNAVSLHRGHD